MHSLDGVHLMGAVTLEAEQVLDVCLNLILVALQPCAVSLSVSTELAPILRICLGHPDQLYFHLIYSTDLYL